MEGMEHENRAYLLGPLEEAEEASRPDGLQAKHGWTPRGVEVHGQVPMTTSTADAQGSDIACAPED